MKTSWPAFAVFCVVCLTFNAEAVTRYVDLKCTNPISPYTNWMTAATNIQDAVDVSTNGDSILVTNGVYHAGSHVDMGVLTVTNALTIQSVNGPDSTIINGGGLLRCAYLGSGALLTGFTLTGGTNSGIAGGVLCPGSTTVISNCVITCNSSGGSAGGIRFGTVLNSIISSNTAFDYGGGAFGCNLTNCILIGNHATEGGGAYYGSAVNCTLVGNQVTQDGGGAFGTTLDYCMVLSNTASVNGGGNYYGSALHSIIEGNSAGGFGGGSYQSTVQACAIARNSADIAGGAYMTAVNHCTITANSASYESGGVEDCTVSNSIVYYNDAPIWPNYADLSGQDPHLNYCCTTPLPPGPGNITNEPALASVSHLSTNSSCRNASTTNSSGRDIDGEIWLAHSSIGCDELSLASATGPVGAQIYTAYTNVAVGKVLNFYGLISGRLTASQWEFGDGTIVSNRPFVEHAWANVGDYPVVLRAFNVTYPTGVTATITIHVVSQPLHYVSLLNTNPLAPYSSWSTAATNIQEAVDAATIPGAMVVVADGIYAFGARLISPQTNRLVVDKPILVKSLNGPRYTTIIGMSSFNPTMRCVYLGDHASLAGFTLTDGNVAGRGGAVQCASANSLVTDCVFSNNTSYGGYDGSFGGAVFWGTVSNCVLLNNSAYAGGAAAYSHLIGCVASGNRATIGAAVYYGTAKQSMLINNEANNYGGGAYGGTLEHCVLAGDSAYYGGGGTYVSTLTACLLTNNYAHWYGGGANGSTLINCVLVGNSTDSAGGGAAGGTLNNCTLVGNSAIGGGAAYASTLNNCVVYFNTGTDKNPNYQDCTLNYCCTTPMPTNGTGNLTKAPLFVDQAGSNLRLQTNSPCINAGNSAYMVGAADLDGRTRIVGESVDIGAYEFQGATTGGFIGWLQQHGLPTDSSADYADTDGDGMNNWQEWIVGTNPTNALSSLKMISGVPANNPPGTIVTWQSVTNRTYFLQRSGDLSVQPPFSTIQSGIAGQTGTTTYSDTSATNGGPYFYRVGVQAP